MIHTISRNICSSEIGTGSTVLVQEAMILAVRGHWHGQGTEKSSMLIFHTEKGAQDRANNGNTVFFYFFLFLCFFVCLFLRQSMSSSLD